MNGDWDYGEVATSYDRRPSYSEAVIEESLHLAELGVGDAACDIGAGTGNLTLPLLRSGLRVVAVEPNSAMRSQGGVKTRHFNVPWVAGLGEAVPLRSGIFRLVAFGSSFNVVNREQALRESTRLLGAGGWFLCLWNHRRLDDPLQASIEAVIREHVPAYAYGTRREDQKPILEASGLFRSVQHIEGAMTHTLSVDDCLAAWRSHLTLRRQAGSRFEALLETIGRELVGGASSHGVSVPYVTRAWLAQR